MNQSILQKCEGYNGNLTLPEFMDQYMFDPRAHPDQFHVDGVVRMLEPKQAWTSEEVAMLIESLKEYRKVQAKAMLKAHTSSTLYAAAAMMHDKATKLILKVERELK